MKKKLSENEKNKQKIIREQKKHQLISSIINDKCTIKEVTIIF